MYPEPWRHGIPLVEQNLAAIGSNYRAIGLRATPHPLASYAVLSSDGATMDGYWESGQGRMGVPPWTNPQTWLDNSPFLHLDHIRTPLLIGVGSYGFPGEQAQADQLYGGLRRLERTAELRRYHGENHPPGTWSPAAYTDVAERILAWIEAPTPPCEDLPGMISV